MRSALLDAVIAAHGGLELWNALESLDADISADGALFRLKGRPALHHQRVRVSTREPRAWFDDYPEPGSTGEFDGDAEVRIRDADGKMVRRRGRPRSAFPGVRRLLWWDDLDFLYFSGYALWNYLTTPFLFMRPGFDLTELPVRRTDAVRRRLRVAFPADVPTHSRIQDFYFDEELRLIRLDYTADIIGWWARGAHVCREHRTFDGIVVPTRRRVTPRARGRPLAGPTIVALTMHSVRACRLP